LKKKSTNPIGRGESTGGKWLWPGGGEGGSIFAEEERYVHFPLPKGGGWREGGIASVR